MTDFVHQALCYGSDDQFLDTTADFVRDGLDTGDTVLAVVSTRTTTLLAEELGSRFRGVESMDVRDRYDCPSRTLGRFHAYCDRQDPSRRVRVVGEPVWEGRRRLQRPGLFSAECDEDGPAHLPAGTDGIRFTRGSSAAVRRAVAAYPRRLGLPEQRTYDLVAAVHEAVVNAVRHGAGQGVVRLHNDPDYVICEVADHGADTSTPCAPFPGHLPPRPHAADGHGMWLVRQLSDLVVDALDPSGSLVRLYFRRPGRDHPAAGSVNS